VHLELSSFEMSASAATGSGTAALHRRLFRTEYRIANRPRATVLLDFNQNSAGHTLAGAYSVRPTPSATVSTPITWAELRAGAVPRDFTIVTPDRDHFLPPEPPILTTSCDPPDAGARAAVPAVARAVRLLDALAAAREPMSLSTLTRTLALPKSTVHNLRLSVQFSFLPGAGR
jgi:hypothetical protein